MIAFYIRHIKKVLAAGFIFLMSPLIQADQKVDAIIAKAEQGDAFVQRHLGGMYKNGIGVPQNHGEALKWYKKAAEQGDTGAQLNLGVMYYKGKGVPQNYVKAYALFNVASANDDKDAIHNRDVAQSKMTPSQIEEAQRMSANWVPGQPIKIP